MIITVEQSLQFTPNNHNHHQNEVFTNSFQIRFRRNIDQQLAHQIAKKHGFINLGPVRIEQQKKNK